ncbi:MAG: hypothetical protein KME29_33845 [Calothrix sp. FI2-JRJ7]|nr:hypothetical protein [Calothrix sp. FI2-JRJ7]
MQAPLHQVGDIISDTQQQYRVVGILGEGSSGVTYAANDLQLGKPVALKVLSLHRINDWKVLELFEREAKILANLEHSSIPQYIDYFQVETEEEKAFYLVQQLAPGKSLFDWINQGWQEVSELLLRFKNWVKEA